MDYVKAFIVGGILCLIGQILIDRTKLTPARILVSYVVCGVVLGAIGIYKPLVDFAGAGATVPLTGFGYNLAKGVSEAVKADGFLGILTGGLKASAGGIAAAITAGLLSSILFRAKDKSLNIGQAMVAAQPQVENGGYIMNNQNKYQNNNQNNNQNSQNNSQNYQNSQNNNQNSNQNSQNSNQNSQNSSQNSQNSSQNKTNR